MVENGLTKNGVDICRPAGRMRVGRKRQLHDSIAVQLLCNFQSVLYVLGFIYNIVYKIHYFSKGLCFLLGVKLKPQMLTLLGPCTPSLRLLHVITVLLLSLEMFKVCHCATGNCLEHELLLMSIVQRIMEFLAILFIGKCEYPAANSLLTYSLYIFACLLLDHRYPPRMAQSNRLTVP